MDLTLRSNVKWQSKPAIHNLFRRLAAILQKKDVDVSRKITPADTVHRLRGEFYAASLTEQFSWKDERGGEGRSTCPNSIFSGRYRADVTSDTRGSSPGRMLFRIIEGRGRMVIRRRGRLIIKFILFTGAKVKFNYTPHPILLETVSFLCDFFFFFHISPRWLVYSYALFAVPMNPDCTWFFVRELSIFFFLIRWM